LSPNFPDRTNQFNDRQSQDCCGILFYARSLETCINRVGCSGPPLWKEIFYDNPCMLRQLYPYKHLKCDKDLHGGNWSKLYIVIYKKKKVPCHVSTMSIITPKKLRQNLLTYSFQAEPSFYFNLIEVHFCPSHIQGQRFDHNQSLPSLLAKRCLFSCPANSTTKNVSERRPNWSKIYQYWETFL
jgi:hypothetical protein